MSEPSATPSSRARLLVVEDDDAIRKMLCTRLEHAGFSVSAAQDGDEALRQLTQARFDLVLLDEMMPGKSGLEVLRRVRETYGPQELPVIMATAKSGSDDVVRALALGANDYVSKPLDLKVLLARIEARLHVDHGMSARAPGAAALASQTGSSLREPPRVIEGRVLEARYRLESVIGSGADGVVWRARHVDLERAVAVKVLKLGTDEHALARFRDEGVSACRVIHPNAVLVSDFGVTLDGIAYLVMELLTGNDLAVELHRHKQLAPARVREIMRPIADALSEAHAAGVIHRDIKPGNIFLHKDKRGEVVKVLDFGIAHLVRDARRAPERSSAGSAKGGIIGTLSYTAPERLEGKEATGSTDVYSLGMLLYEMLTGAPPFDTLEDRKSVV